MGVRSSAATSRYLRSLLCVAKRLTNKPLRREDDAWISDTEPTGAGLVRLVEEVMRVLDRNNKKAANKPAASSGNIRAYFTAGGSDGGGGGHGDSSGGGGKGKGKEPID